MESWNDGIMAGVASIVFHNSNTPPLRWFDGSVGADAEDLQNALEFSITEE